MDLLFVWSFYLICSSISIFAIHLAINNQIFLSGIVTCIGITFSYYYIKTINDMLANYV